MGKQKRSQKPKPELPQLLPDDVVMRNGYPWAFSLGALCEIPLSIEQARKVLTHALSVLGDAKSIDQVNAVRQMPVSELDPLRKPENFDVFGDIA